MITTGCQLPGGGRVGMSKRQEQESWDRGRYVPRELGGGYVQGNILRWRALNCWPYFFFTHTILPQRICHGSNKLCLLCPCFEQLKEKFCYTLNCAVVDPVFPMDFCDTLLWTHFFRSDGFQEANLALWWQWINTPSLSKNPGSSTWHIFTYLLTVPCRISKLYPHQKIVENF